MISQSTDLTVSPGKIKTLTGSLNGAPFILDPAKILDSSQWHTLINLGVTLVRHDASGRLVGEAAKSWTVSSDFKTFTFELRRDIKDSQGAVLDSSDWKASFTHLLRSGGSTHSFVSEFLNEAGIETPSSYKLQLQLKKPYQTFLQRLTTPEFILVPKRSITPANVVELSVSSGDYFVERLTDSPRKCVLRANRFNHHYCAEQAEQVVLEPIATSNKEAFDKLASDTWQFYIGTVLPTDPTFQEFKKQLDTGKLHAIPVAPSSIAVLILQDSKRLITNSQRLALAKLLGERAAKDFSSLSAKFAHQLYPHGFVGALSPQREQEIFEQIQKDPTSSKEHLPKKLIGYEAAVSSITGVAHWVKETLKNAGVEVETHPATAKEYIGHQKEIDHDYLAFTTGLNSKDPAGSLLYLISPKDGIVPDPTGELNRLLSEAVQADPAKRTELLHKISEELVLSGRIIPIMHYGTQILSSSSVDARPPTDFDDELRLADIRWKK
ncbi:ABC transporter substrate-binding protein [Bdellovibrionota bacterium FG-1]